MQQRERPGGMQRQRRVIRLRLEDRPCGDRMKSGQRRRRASTWSVKGDVSPAKSDS